MLGFSNKEGGRSSDNGLFRFVAGLFGPGLIGGFVVRQNSPLGMSVLIGGQNGVYDNLIIRDSDDGAAYPIFNPDGQPIVATVSPASAVNPRKDLVVIYIDNGESPDDSIYDNTNMVKAMVVAGTPAGSPLVPDATAITTAIGAGNPYYVRATLTIPANATTITDAMIANDGMLVGSSLKPVTSFVVASESTASTSYTDLTTVTDTVTVNVGASGKVKVEWGASCFNTLSNGYSCIGVQVSGANTEAASDNRSVALQGTTEDSLSGSRLYEGLTPGLTTFKLKYRTPAGTSHFYRRYITAEPR